MDGLKKRVGASLQVQLSLWLGLAILVAALLSAVFVFRSAYSEAIDLQDDQLRQLADMIAGYESPLTDYTFAGNPRQIDPETQIVVEQLPKGAGHMLTQGPLAGLESGRAEGLYTVRPGKLAWRIAIRNLRTGAQIAVGQRIAVRGEIARDSAVNALLPVLLLIPTLLLVCHLLVRAAFRPLASLASELDQRAQDDLRGISESDLPREIHPFVVALNRMLRRVADSMASQRRFIADAAHELRSPLAAMSLQAERLQDASMSEPARERLATLRLGIDRNHALVTQLLALARTRDQSTQGFEVVSAQAVFRAVVEELWPLAEAKHIDIGVAGDQDAQMRDAQQQLHTLVRNLVDNAIRYTPPHGRVDLSVHVGAQWVTLAVSDNGPGIPPAQRERVFEPFYRTLGTDESGSGLGLSIVKSIAANLQAEIELDFTDPVGASGLTVRVLFPIRTATAGRT